MKWSRKSTMFCLCIMLSASCSGLLGRTITLKVETVSGSSIAEAQVRMDFLGSLPGKGDVRRGVTDSEGEVALSGSDEYGVEIRAKKPGYYLSEKKVGGDEDKSVQLTLREKKNPIPMYVREKWLYFPEKGKRIGFDLKIGDWVSPYGKGEASHVYFKLNGISRGVHDGRGELTISFPNNKGGIRAANAVNRFSEHQFPYNAPEEGYTPTLVHEYEENPNESGRGHTEHKTMDPRLFGYFFKVVTADKEGSEKESAFYGKLRGEFQFRVGKQIDHEGVGLVGFTYYFNPNPNDRNIEFDPQRNLFDDVEKTFPP